jgi:hypothetical protein
LYRTDQAGAIVRPPCNSINLGKGEARDLLNRREIFPLLRPYTDV